MECSTENFSRMEHKFIKPINAVDIPPGNYEGWFWMSDAVMPVRMNGSPFTADQLTEMPFVVEAQLYDTAAKVSLSIRHFDGAYCIVQYDLAAILDGKYEQKCRTLLGHRLSGNEDHQPWVKVVDVWMEHDDEYCAGMKALLPLCSIFTGFSK